MTAEIRYRSMQIEVPKVKLNKKTPEINIQIQNPFNIHIN